MGDFRHTTPGPDPAKPNPGTVHCRPCHESATTFIPLQTHVLVAISSQRTAASATGPLPMLQQMSPMAHLRAPRLNPLRLRLAMARKVINAQSANSRGAAMLEVVNIHRTNSHRAAVREVIDAHSADCFDGRHGAGDHRRG